jgi:predicted MPP superfamily phosphohydrolase
MTKLPPENPLLRELQQRVGASHLRLRLGIESDHEAQIFGQGRNLVHIENWYSIHALIKNMLRMLLLLDRGRRNALNIRTLHNDISVAGLPSAFDGFSILHISDLHLDINPFMSTVLIDTLLGVHYDMCVLTGDFRARTYGPFEPALDRMRAVRTHLKEPVYAVLGNHDSIMMVPGLEDMGIAVLINESVALSRGGAEIYLVGIDDPHYYRADNMEKATKDLSLNAIWILLSHSPEIFRHAAHMGFDVMLCGHTHGGQICLPGGMPIMCNARCPRELCSGPWAYQRLKGYTSRGSGVSVVDVRLNCPPEITLHRLRKA